MLSLSIRDGKSVGFLGANIVLLVPDDTIYRPTTTPGVTHGFIRYRFTVENLSLQSSIYLTFIFRNVIEHLWNRKHTTKRFVSETPEPTWNLWKKPS